MKVIGPLLRGWRFFHYSSPVIPTSSTVLSGRRPRGQHRRPCAQGRHARLQGLRSLYLPPKSQSNLSSPVHCISLSSVVVVVSKVRGTLVGSMVCKISIFSFEPPRCLPLSFPFGCDLPEPAASKLSDESSSVLSSSRLFLSVPPPSF
jgi:hypothetical protein